MNRQLCATPRTVESWHDIDFKAAEDCVKKLQMRIAKAVKEKKWGKVKSLQWTLTHSFYAKALAIKRVTENKGKRTSGVDHEIWESPESKFKAIGKLSRRGYRAQPLRRIYIKKKNGKLRPLSVPTMTDRAMQTLYRFALDPVAETTADIHSYGFRPQRCVQDAIERCFQTLGKQRSPVWVLEGDIKGCFDNISHEWIMKNIPLDKSILYQFLKSGYMETGKLFPTELGTPQGGTISTTICNMVLDGLEPLLKAHFKPKWVNGKMYYPAINYTRYADDFIITGKDPEILENEVKPIVRRFLEKRGLALSEEKTLITHIDDGFEFLGCNIRKFNGKLLTRPSKDSIKSFLRKIRGIIRQNKTVTQQDLIMKLNPVIRGWVNFHRFNVSSDAFHYMDSEIFEALWRWAKRRHHNKGSKWVARRYYHRINDRSWTFAAKISRKDGTEGYFSLERAADTKIVRFPGIRDGANPYDAEWQLYFEERETEKMRVTVRGNHALRRLFNIQRGRCALCGEKLTLETGGRCHKYKHNNLSLNYLVHPDCHRRLHQFDSFQPVHCGSNGL